MGNGGSFTDEFHCWQDKMVKSISCKAHLVLTISLIFFFPQLSLAPPVDSRTCSFDPYSLWNMAHHKERPSLDNMHLHPHPHLHLVQPLIIHRILYHANVWLTCTHPAAITAAAFPTATLAPGPDSGAARAQHLENTQCSSHFIHSQVIYLQPCWGGFEVELG